MVQQLTHFNGFQDDRFFISQREISSRLKIRPKVRDWDHFRWHQKQCLIIEFCHMISLSTYRNAEDSKILRWRLLWYLLMVGRYRTNNHCILLPKEIWLAHLVALKSWNSRVYIQRFWIGNFIIQKNIKLNKMPEICFEAPEINMASE